MGSEFNKRVKRRSSLKENDVISTNAKGLAVIDFNDEVIGTVIIAPNTQVILRRSNTDGVRLLSLVRGHIRLYRGKAYENKKVGVLINIRDNPTAYHGTNFEVQYYRDHKKVTSFNSNFREFKLRKKLVTLEAKKELDKADVLDQELQQDLKYLLESS